MLRWNPILARAILVCCAVAMLSPSITLAGEAVSERDELDNGPSFFGEAKEVGSLRPIQNVQVKAELGEQRISTYTSDEGSFKIPGFGPDIAVDNVVIACAKAGYRTVDLSRRRLSGAADAPVGAEEHGAVRARETREVADVDERGDEHHLDTLVVPGQRGQQATRSIAHADRLRSASSLA